MPHILLTVEESFIMAQIRNLNADQLGREEEKRLWRELRPAIRMFFQTESGLTNPIADE